MMSHIHRPSIRLAFLAALVALSIADAASRQQLPAHLQGAIERIDAMAAAEYAKDNVGSLTIGVVERDQLVWTRSYGYADGERKVPATKDTIYRIGSITKQFTALMLLQLVQDRTIRLSDPVERYLPEVNTIKDRHATAPPITLLQLATMTSGVAREPANLAKHLIGPVAQWEQVTINALAETRYEHEPGTRFLYSNIGYAILGAAISRAARTPYTAYVRDRIFTPLGMRETSFEPVPALAAQIAKGYEIDSNGHVSFEAPQREHAGRGYKVPNGAIYTTVGDLARFVSFELGEGPETVLKRSTLQDHQSRVMSSSGALDSGYGVGFQLTRRGANVFLGHSGSVAGYTAQAVVHLPSKTGVIVLRNAGGGKFQMGPLTFRAMEALAGAGKS